MQPAASLESVACVRRLGDESPPADIRLVPLGVEFNVE